MERDNNHYFNAYIYIIYKKGINGRSKIGRIKILFLAFLNLFTIVNDKICNSNARVRILKWNNWFESKIFNSLPNLLKEHWEPKNLMFSKTFLFNWRISIITKIAKEGNYIVTRYLQWYKTCTLYFVYILSKTNPVITAKRMLQIRMRIFHLSYQLWQPK